MRNPTVLAACIIGMFDFISFYLQFTYQCKSLFPNICRESILSYLNRLLHLYHPLQ